MSEDFKIFHLKSKYFALFAVIVLLSAMLGVLQAGMIGCFAFMIVCGAILQEIGDHLPNYKYFFRRRSCRYNFRNGLSSLCKFLWDF